MPLLRYRTRDLTRITTEPCKCGRTHARMEKVMGRSDDMLKIRGVNVFPSQIESVIMQIPQISPHYMLYIRREGYHDTLEVQVELVDGSLLNSFARAGRAHRHHPRQAARGAGHRRQGQARRPQDHRALCRRQGQAHRRSARHALVSLPSPCGRPKLGEVAYERTDDRERGGGARAVRGRLPLCFLLPRHALDRDHRVRPPGTTRSTPSGPPTRRWRWKAPWARRWPGRAASPP